MKAASVSLGVAAIVVGFAISAAAGTAVQIDGRFKETYPKGPQHICFTGEPCGLGDLLGFGQAAETFTFEGFDGRDSNGCAMIHGTDTITLNDAQRSSFTEREHDTGCFPGSSHDTTGRFVSYGNPERFAGSWALLPGTGTGVFSTMCEGSGTIGNDVAGSTAVVTYRGSLVSC